VIGPKHAFIRALAPNGRTLIAGEQTARHAFLMEIDPLYADVIVQRFKRFTGKEAELHGGKA